MYGTEDDTYRVARYQNNRCRQRDQLNDTYADFGEADLEVVDPSETRDEYDSENEDHN